MKQTENKICKECGYPKWYQDKYEVCDCCGYDSEEGYFKDIEEYEYVSEADHRLEEYDKW